MITWFSRKQTYVALSLAEAEYMAVSMASCEAIWLHKVLTGLFNKELEPTLIYFDNQSCIKLSENPVFHDRSKHIEIRITSSKKVSRREQLSFNISPLISRLQTF